MHKRKTDSCSDSRSTRNKLVTAFADRPSILDPTSASLYLRRTLEQQDGTEGTGDSFPYFIVDT